jgi:DNA-binding XRE family transcriptional regulator
MASEEDKNRATIFFHININYDVLYIDNYLLVPSNKVLNMITGSQLKAARALLGINQRQLADISGLSLPTIQRMESSDDVVRGNVDSLMKVVEALENAGVEVIGIDAVSNAGGRGVRLKI